MTRTLLAALFTLQLGACGGEPGAAGTSGAAGGGTAGSGTTSFAGTSGAPGGGTAGSGTTGAAGTSGAAGTGMAVRPPSKSVEETLDRLGVERNIGDRMGANGKPLSSTFDPLVNQSITRKVNELFMMGLPFKVSASSTAVRTGNATFMQFDAQAPDLMARVDPDPAWGSSRAKLATAVVRAAASGDVDHDGREETLVAWWNPTATGHDQEINLTIIDDSQAARPFALSTQTLALQAGVKSLSLAAADFDGDQEIDIALGVVTPTGGKLLFARNDKGTFRVDDTATKTLAPAVAPLPSGDGMTLTLQPARVDRDGAAELAVVVNELVGDSSGAARYFVYDDALAGYAQLQGGAVPAAPGQPAPVTADVAAGDIDGDGLDELVLGGLAGFNKQCAGYKNYAVALDDAEHTFAQLGTTSSVEYWHDCDDADPFQIRWAAVRMLNVDLDDQPEILVGNTVYDDWKSTQRFTAVRTLPQEVFVQKADKGWLDRTTTAVATGDFTGDGQDDVLVFSQDRAQVALLEATLSVPAAAGTTPSLRITRALPVTYKSSDVGQNVVLLPVNVDSDSVSLRRSSLEHKLVFTQPIVIAALAAAPCQQGISQNTDACVTTFGTATTQTVEEEKVLSVSAGLTVGIKIDGGEITQSEASFKASVTTTASRSTGTATSISRSVTFTSGPMEDTVVFSTVPYDVYEYTVLTHPDPKMVGAKVAVRLPRRPIVLMTERSFYNDAIPAGGLKIDERVFRHTAGDISTYPTQADVLKLKNDLGGKVKTSNTWTVGEGQSSTQFQLDVGSELSQGQSLAVEYEMEVEATVATVIGGFSVGAGAESSLRVTSGSSTSYSGTVGSIGDRTSFMNNLYSYGLFTYVQADAGTGQRFEVVNFWVEK